MNGPWSQNIGLSAASCFLECDGHSEHSRFFESFPTWVMSMISWFLKWTCSTCYPIFSFGNNNLFFWANTTIFNCVHRSLRSEWWYLYFIASVGCFEDIFPHDFSQLYEERSTASRFTRLSRDCCDSKKLNSFKGVPVMNPGNCGEIIQFKWISV